MNKKYEVGGTTYEFPDDIDDAGAKEILTKKGIIKPASTDKIIEVPKSFSSRALEIVRPAVSGVAQMGASALTAPAGPLVSGAAGVAAGFGTDALMQKMQGEDREPSITSRVAPGLAPPNSPWDIIASSGEQNLMGAIIGKMLKPLATGAAGVYKEAMHGGVVNSLAKELGATTSQYSNRPVAEFIEDVGARAAKSRAVEYISRKGKALGEEYTQFLSQIRSAADTKDPHVLAKYIQESAQKNFESSLAASNERAMVSKGIADLNPERVLSHVEQTTGPNGSTMMQPVYETVRGPVEMKGAAQWARNYVEQKNKAVTVPDEEKELVEAAKKLLSMTDAQFDGAGRVISARPISFSDAWDVKKQLDGLGYGAPKQEITKAASFFQSASQAVTQDMEAGISKWKNGSQQASNAFKQAKAIVEKRNTEFKEASNIPTLLNTTDSPIPALERIIDDPVELTKLLNTGSLGNPTGALQKYGVKGFTSNNLKADVKAYQFARMMDNAKIQPTEAGLTEETFGKSQLLAQLNNPKNQQMLDKLYSKNEQETFRNFFNVIGDTTQQPAGNNYFKMRMAGTGLVLGSGLVTAMLSGSPSSGLMTSAVGGTGLLSMMALGKLLTNKNAAPYLEAFMKGEPLGVSQKYAMKVISGALVGTAMELKMPDGTSKTVKFLPGGETKEVQ